MATSHEPEPEPKTLETETQNPSPNSISEEPNLSNPSPESSVKRKREEEEQEVEEDVPKKTKHPLHKTSMCSYFRRNSGSCSHGEGCRFAHNEEELQPRPDGSWDPTSDRVKRREIENVEEEEEEEKSVMMTEILAESGDPQLSKCLIHLPRKWNSDQLKTFLDEQVLLTRNFNY